MAMHLTRGDGRGAACRSTFGWPVERDEDVTCADCLLAALAEHAAEMHMGMDCECETCDRRRTLLAKIDGDDAAR